MAKIIEWLKKIPIDLGQGSVAETTMGKKIALDFVNDGRGKTALDIGCREGKQTKWLRSRSYKVTSIDVEKVFEDCQVVDANKGLPFPDNSFDLVWSSEVIEHLENPEFVANEIRRVTKKGGDMILTTPNSYALLFQFIALFGLTPQRIQRKDHIHFFNEKDVRQLFPKATILGYFPYMFIKRRIQSGIGALSPTFVIHETK